MINKYVFRLGYYSDKIIFNVIKDLETSFYHGEIPYEEKNVHAQIAEYIGRAIRKLYPDKELTKDNCKFIYRPTLSQDPLNIEETIIVEVID